MDKLKIVYMALLAVIGLLLISVTYQAATQTFSSTLTQASKHEVITVGDEIAANFKIHNPTQESRQYTYALYLNDEKKYENTVPIKPNRRSVFGGHFRALEPGEVKVTALVYEGDKEKLVKNMTYFVTVNPR